MSVIGVNFSRISVLRKDQSEKKINVQNNIGISGVDEASLKIGGSENVAVRFKFVFHCQYQPDIGHVNLDGEVVMLLSKKEADAAVKEWNDGRRVSGTYATQVLNAALSKAQILALTLSKEVNLPAPIQLPKVVPKMTAPAQQAAAPSKKK